jgi:hypothetical protein
MMRQTKVALAMSDQYLEIMDRLEYRRVESSEDLEEVGRLRSRSYGMLNLIDQQGTSIIDDADLAPNAHVFAVFYDGVIVSTIRLHHITREQPAGTSTKLFPDVVLPLLDQDMTFIDAVRHATDPDFLNEFPTPFLTLRLAAMASEYFAVDYCLAPVIQFHAAFYRRAFGATQLAEAKAFKGIKDPIALFGAKVETIYDRVATRYPFFMSHPVERRMLFAKASELSTAPLSVRPLARVAMRDAAAQRSAA